MKRLSPESIRRRFSSPRRELSDLELHRLTAMDGWNQYAIGACGRAADGTLEGIGIARYARLPGDDAAAEIAVTVVDAFQHRGIGLALLERIVEAATARGIRRLDAMVLPENRPVIGLLRRLAPWARWRPDEGQLIAEIPLRAEPVVVSATG
jgi:ribosomal protein S18 acetylase RimI-like enzyme